MQFMEYRSEEALARRAAEIAIEAIAQKPETLICPASGGSPVGTYAELARHRSRHPDFFRRARMIQLDEWLGLSQDHPASCAFFMNRHLVKPLGLRGDQVFLFDGLADGRESCRRAADFLSREGPIDLGILGLGANGHLGFNEPGLRFSEGAHQADLEPGTREHAMVRGLSRKPTTGITLGIGDLLKARQLVLIVAGANKAGALQQLISGEITPSLPASALWRHERVTCLIPATR